MHIPPYHKKRSWQIFFLGMFAGTIIAYTVIMFMYGKMYENLLVDQSELQTKFNEVKAQNEALLEDKEKLEEEANIIIHYIEITFLNDKQLKLDRVSTHQFENIVKQELHYIIGKEVKSVSDNDNLLISVIENKTYTVDDKSYKIEIKRISISEKVKLTLIVKLED